jgi:hypothetical protein
MVMSGLLGLLLLWPNTERARLRGQTPVRLAPSSRASGRVRA